MKHTFFFLALCVTTFAVAQNYTLVWNEDAFAAGHKTASSTALSTSDSRCQTKPVTITIK